jgi:hypothetical protein
MSVIFSKTSRGENNLVLFFRETFQINNSHFFRKKSFVNFSSFLLKEVLSSLKVKKIRNKNNQYFFIIFLKFGGFCQGNDRINLVDEPE